MAPFAGGATRHSGRGGGRLVRVLGAVRASCRGGLPLAVPTSTVGGERSHRGDVCPCLAERGRFRDVRGASALPWLLGIAANVLADTVRRNRIETEARERLG